MIITNDSSGNVNSTEWSNFTVGDIDGPVVESVLPDLNSSYGALDVFEISANVGDGLGVSFVFANITFPNSTVVLVILNNSIGDKYNSQTIKDHSIFICGAEVMRESYIKQLLEKGISINDIHYEEFSFR